MAATVTLSRPGGSSVDIDLIAEGGDMTVARDIGKPNLNIHDDRGHEEPRSQDHQNSQAVWTIVGTLLGSNAYSDAKTLAEDIIKPRMSDPLDLDMTDLTNRTTYRVVPASEDSLSLTYVPAETDIVGVQLGLVEVEDVFGGTQTAAATQSPDSGRGIRITRGATSVDLVVDNALTRKVGRPGMQLVPSPNSRPVAFDRNMTASDRFELSGVFIDSASTTATTLEGTIVDPPLGPESLTLEFLSNTYGLDKYDVVPNGTQAIRTTVAAGAEDIYQIPKLQFRAVDNS